MTIIRSSGIFRRGRSGQVFTGGSETTAGLVEAVRERRKAASAVAKKKRDAARYAAGVRR